MVRSICFILLASSPAYGQSIGAAPSFEVAPVKPSPQPDPGKPMYFGCRYGTARRPVWYRTVRRIQSLVVDFIVSHQ